MLVLRQFEKTALSKPLFLALGNFDGVHAGHQEILSRVCRDAREQGGLAAVMTFAEHPRMVLGHSGPGLLYSPEQKLFYLAETGIDVCFLLSFTEAFSKLEAASFVSEILVKELKVKKVYLGHDSRFGHDRKGDDTLMAQMAEKHGFDFEPVPPVSAHGKHVSSSRIRALVEAGDFKEASILLGRPFSMFAKVVKGDGRGAGLGFPTANFDISQRVQLPAGVYPVALRTMDWRETGGQWHFNSGTAWYQAAANWGYRPTFHPGAKEAVLEAFILDFPGADLYGKVFEVLFYPQIRPEKTFSGVEQLKAQIEKDVRAVREAFLQNPPSSS